MTESLPIVPRAHGRRLLGRQPLVFHCNHYNHWLQHALRLDGALGMDDVIRAAAAEVAADVVSGAADPVAYGAEVFRQLGFGTLVFDGPFDVHTPTSHYGQLLRLGASEPASRPQNLFDQGIAAGVASGVHDGPVRVRHATCFATGAEEARIALEPGGPGPARSADGGPHSRAPLVRPFESSIDEAAVLSALAGLELTGNEEGFIPRFGVMLTHHFANFYNRISFEFVRRMADSGLLEEAEQLLIDAGYRCAFNTFGGIMVSDEWYAVVRPMIREPDDWVHGMVAVTNALGWGTWRVRELSEDRVVVRVYDDYESAGYAAMYGRAERPVCFLHMGGVAGLMHLARYGDIASRPALDEAYFERCFEVERPFVPRVTANFAAGDDYTEIVAERV